MQAERAAKAIAVNCAVLPIQQLPQSFFQSSATMHNFQFQSSFDSAELSAVAEEDTEDVLEDASLFTVALA